MCTRLLLHTFVLMLAELVSSVKFSGYLQRDFGLDGVGDGGIRCVRLQQRRPSISTFDLEDEGIGGGGGTRALAGSWQKPCRMCSVERVTFRAGE